MKISFVAAFFSVVGITLLMIRKFKISRRAAIFCAFVLLIFYAVSAYAIETSSFTTRWQRQTIKGVRSAIDRGTAITVINDALLNTMAEYVRQPATSKRSLAAAFTGLFEISNNYLIKFSSDDDHSYLYTSKVTDDTIVVVYQCNVSMGRNPEFKNFHNATGRLQAKGILTKEGIAYIDEN